MEVLNLGYQAVCIASLASATSEHKKAFSSLAQNKNTSYYMSGTCTLNIFIELFELFNIIVSVIFKAI